MKSVLDAQVNQMEALKRMIVGYSRMRGNSSRLLDVRPKWKYKKVS